MSRRNFGESKYRYAFKIFNYKYCQEPLNALSALFISAYGYNQMHLYYHQKIYVTFCMFLILNGVTSCWMHLFLPTDRYTFTNFIASFDFGSMISALYYVYSENIFNSITLMGLYSIYNCLFYHRTVECILDFLFAVGTFLMCAQVTIQHGTYPSFFMGVVSMICQIIDNESALDHLYFIRVLRAYLPLHTLWHILIVISLCDMLHFKYELNR